MPDRDYMGRTAGLPATVDSLTRDLSALGVRAGMTLLVHSSLSSMGWIMGGAPAVIAALTAALGDDGTLVMPTHTGDLSDPAAWVAPPVPAAWHAHIRTHMPAYHPATSVTRLMGAIPESFRAHPHVRRSAHPRQSCAARGAQADFVTDHHALDCAMGERSPLARVYDLDGQVLLLGVGHDRNTSLHLAEHRARYPARRKKSFGSPVMVDGQRRWLEVQDLDFDDSDFAAIGAAFERETADVTLGPVGYATARLMRQRPLVDFGARWMSENRRA
ncbi:MAG: AAC(3) family N-acetyltransferase [Alphaproteobacteria bacterium]|nr:AAC(3) family N-acetyltransferase [Alphaproteobacteria bacterium]